MISAPIVSIYAQTSTSNSSSSSFYIRATATKRKFWLSHCFLATVSELSITLCALRHNTDILTPHCWVILTGSQVALMSVEDNDSDSCTAPLVYRILLAYSAIVESGHSVVFQCIPGHCHIKRNVEADRLAREAHSLLSSDIVPFSTGNICTLL